MKLSRNLIKARQLRCFSVLTASAEQQIPTTLNLHRVSGRSDHPAPVVYKEKTEVQRHKKVDLKADSCFTRDKAFLKFLTWINLESTDKESISIARLIAYNIFHQLKDDVENGDDVISGVAKGFKVILTSLTKMSRPITTDSSLTLKACEVYSKGLTDIAKIVSYLHCGESRKELVVTKEISRSSHEGTVKVQKILPIGVGHASHHYINDGLNYRVDIENPIIVLSEKLSSEDVDYVLDLTNQSGRGVIFVARLTERDVGEFILDKRMQLGTTLSLMNLSEDVMNSSEYFRRMEANLRELDISKTNSPVKFKQAERVIMEGATTYFVDSSFEQELPNSPVSFVTELVEIQLRSPDEAWMHRYRNDVIDAYKDLEDSLKMGVLPSIKTGFFFANEELKTYYSENKAIQRGIEIVQKAMDDFISEIDEEGLSQTEVNLEDHFETSISEGTFVPTSKATKVVTDIVTICNSLLLKHMSDSGQEYQSSLH